jgi:uncharacterized protein YdbL (DUF1318 family)
MTIHSILLALLVTMLVSPAALAQRDGDDEDNGKDTPAKQELKEKFKKRLPEINKLKDSGEIGETWEGYLEAVDKSFEDDKDLRKLVDDENSDRRKLYKLISEETAEGDKKLSPEQVGRRNAIRNLKRARGDDYLKIKEGRWIQKRDDGRADRLAKLKEAGKVGETAGGLVDAVGGAEAEGQSKSTIEKENEWRREFYQRIAKARDTSDEKVAAEWGREILSHVPQGQHYQNEDGKWVKK